MVTTRGKAKETEDHAAAEGAAAPAPRLAALPQDCLEIVCARCPCPDLIKLRETCRGLNSLLSSSENVWAHRMWADFGLRLRALPGAPAGALLAAARAVYGAPAGGPVRLQGAFTSGGVDEAAPRYWVDNMFRRCPDSYCSNARADADAVALLLDGAPARDEEAAALRAYLSRRVRYAAALILNLGYTSATATDDEVDEAIGRWSDARLERFFADLAGALAAGHHLGRLLLHGVPPEHADAEAHRVAAADAVLRRREAALEAGLLRARRDRDAFLDAALLPKLAREGADGGGEHVAVVHELLVARSGPLTCPVRCGAVFGGVLDAAAARALAPAPADALAFFRAAVRLPPAAAFNGLKTEEQVEAAAREGRVPPILRWTTAPAGRWCEFDAGSGPPPPAEPASVEVDGVEVEVGSAAAWRPIAWFCFDSAAAAAAPAVEPAALGEALAAAQPQAVAPAPQLPAAAQLPAAEAHQQQPAAEAQDLAEIAQAIAAGMAHMPAGQQQAALAAAAQVLAAAAAQLPAEAGQQEEAMPPVAEAAEGAASEDIEHSDGGDDEAMDEGGSDDDEEGDDEEGEEILVDAGDDEGGEALELRLRLRRPRGVNALLVKLIDQDNLMGQYNDEHAWPNIDCTQCLVTRGRLVALPPGVAAKP